MSLLKRTFKFMINFCMIFVLIFCYNSIIVKANELPQIKLMGIDHLPIVEGDSETFYLSSTFDKESEKCDIQYKIFMNEINTNKYEELTKGYTKPVNPDEIYKFSCDKKFTEGEYKILIWVKRYGKQCKNNKYDTCSSTTLKCLNKKNEINVNKKLDLGKEIFFSGQNISIDDIGELDKKYLYKFNYYNVSKKVWSKNITSYSKKISWKPILAGDYILQILVKSPNSTKQYDGKILKLITIKEKPTDDVLIAYKDDYVYYGNGQDNYKLYKKNIDGTRQEKLCDDSISKINIKGEWIYYINQIDNKVYKISENGSKKQEVFTESEKTIFKENNLINFKIKIPNDFENGNITIKNCFDERLLDIELEDLFYEKETHKIITSKVLAIGLNPGISSEEDEIYFDSSWKDQYIYLGTLLKSIDGYSNYYLNEKERRLTGKIENPNYAYFKKLLSSKESIDEKIYEEKMKKCREEEQREKELKEKEEQRRIQLKENKNIPIRTGIYFYTPNEEELGETKVIEDSIGYPVANITVDNLSDKEIDAFKISFRCYNAFDEPVNEFLSTSNTFYGIAENTSLKSGEFTEYRWSLGLYDLTTKIKNIKILQVHFTDGTVWKNK